MHLSEQFLALTKQQLQSFQAESAVELLVVYLAQSKEGQDPSLEAIGQWPEDFEKSLPAVELDPDLRVPSSFRRWYPLQDGSILLGVIRVESNKSENVWSEALDRRLQATANALSQFLSVELDRNRLSDELDRQRDQISLMVHQLRNPLAALRTYTQLLLRRLGPESKDINLIEGLLSEQVQLNKYVSALDKISQTSLASNTGISTPLLLPPVLSQDSELNFKCLLVPLIQRASARASLQGREWFSPEEWPVWTDNLRPEEDGVIAEIVANLIENAFRYSENNCSIGICLSDKGICVWDEGKPIEYKDRENIFKKGFRGSRSLDSNGSGIGLSLGRELAKQLGGSLSLIDSPIDFDLSLPKKGNAFVLKLPEIKLKIES
tara:strand:- start:160 stop:1296 length:1137 start_codon:yes stop_codon:yes gene_type:complete